MSNMSQYDQHSSGLVVFSLEKCVPTDPTMTGTKYAIRTAAIFGDREPAGFTVRIPINDTARERYGQARCAK